MSSHSVVGMENTQRNKRKKNAEPYNTWDDLDSPPAKRVYITSAAQSPAPVKSLFPMSVPFVHVQNSLPGPSSSKPDHHPSTPPFLGPLNSPSFIKPRLVDSFGKLPSGPPFRNRPSTPTAFSRATHRPSRPPSFSKPFHRPLGPPSFSKPICHPSVPPSVSEPDHKSMAVPFSKPTAPISLDNPMLEGLTPLSSSKPHGTPPISPPTHPLQSSRQPSAPHLVASPSLSLPDLRRVPSCSKAGPKTFHDTTNIRKDMPVMQLDVREIGTKARGDPPQSTETLSQIGSRDARQILLGAHQTILGLASDLDYSQAALSYGSRMEAVVTLEVKFDRALEHVREQLVHIQSLVRNLL